MCNVETSDMPNRNIENANRTAGGIESEMLNPSIQDYANPAGNELLLPPIKSNLNKAFIGERKEFFARMLNFIPQRHKARPLE
jgi:hypothetical protein